MLCWDPAVPGVLRAALCVPRFCGECLQPCLQVPSPLCPLCRVPFDPKKVEKASSVEKQLSSYKAPCRGCSKKVKLPVPIVTIVPILLWNGGSGSAQFPDRRGPPDGGWALLPENGDRTCGNPCSPKSLSCKEGRVGAAFPLLWVIPHGPEVTATLAKQSQLLSWLLAGVPAPPGVFLVLLFQVTLAKMRSHVSSCAKVQEQMANCPKFVPVVPTSQPIPRYSCALGRETCPSLHALKSRSGFPWEEEQHLFPPGTAALGFGAWGGIKNPPNQGGGMGRGWAGFCCVSLEGVSAASPQI